jgi:hypothetical protein
MNAKTVIFGQRCNSGAYRWTRSPRRDVIGVQAPLGEQLLDVAIRKVKSASYQPTAKRITSGSNCRHLE